MTLTAGERLGPYEVLAPIGAGGMGEVYKARDTRLDRIVAIKVSQEKFSDRFEREARAVAALNHPHICTLHDVGPNYLVMEYVAGAPLKGPLPLEKAVEYAGQILDALDAAHQKGIIHRDLKPANILVTRQGIKLLDFGLAKMRAGAGLDDRMMTEALTGQGQILGTLHYMSPEQLQGKEADARSDIFSFGLVLYEMLTGARAFEAESAASLIANIIHKDPPALSTRQPLTPQALERVQRTCIAKDPDERFQSARDLKRALAWSAGSGAAAVAAPSEKPKRSWMPWVLAGVFAAAAMVLAGAWLRRPATQPQTVQFQITPEQGATVSSPNVSPDGQRIAFVATGVDGRSQMLWVRRIDNLKAQAVSGSDSAYMSFWSPDSRRLGYATPLGLWVAGLEGAPPQRIAESTVISSAAWGAGDTIVYSLISGPLMRIPVNVGKAVPVTTLDMARKEIFHFSPRFLPGGQRFLYGAITADTRAVTICAGDLDGNPPRRITTASSQADFTAGYLLFLRGSTLMAQSLNTESLRLSGESFAVAAPVGGNNTSPVGFFAASASGVIAWSGLPAEGGVDLTWYERSGKPAGVLDPGRLLIGGHTEISPDGTQVVFDRVSSSGEWEIWVQDLRRGIRSKLSHHADQNWVPAWSATGSDIYYISTESSLDSAVSLYQRRADGSGEPVLVYRPPSGMVHHTNASLDGRYLLFENAPTIKVELWVVDLSAGSKATPWLQSQFDTMQPQFSPDSRWVAYVSDESSRFEVYVRNFAQPGKARWQISTGGGVQPRWRRDGRELVYLAADGHMMSVPVETGGSFHAGTPQPVFTAPLKGTQTSIHFTMTADARRFLMDNPPKQEPAVPLNVIVNWQPTRNK